MPDLISDIEDFVDKHTQSDRCHNDTKGYVKITEAKVKSHLIEEKEYPEDSFGSGTINNVLNRLGYTLKKVRKTLPLKRLPETDMIFNNVFSHRNNKAYNVLKISIDVKDKVKVGKLSRSGCNREKSPVEALDKDQHWDETLVPLGILEIESGQSTVMLGNSFETSDFIIDALAKWFELRKDVISQYEILEIYLDNGPSVNSSRTQFIDRIMEFASITGLTIHLLYYPPYHSKYNPIERVWAALENYWNGALLTTREKVVETIKNITWKKIHPLVGFIDKVYQKGIRLTKKQMLLREKYLIRNHELPKWELLSSLPPIWVDYFFNSPLMKWVHRPDRCDLSIFSLGHRYLFQLIANGLTFPKFYNLDSD